MDSDIKIVDVNNEFHMVTGRASRSALQERECACCGKTKDVSDYWPSSLWCKTCTVTALVRMKRQRK
jgi:hypothetical protein